MNVASFLDWKSWLKVHYNMIILINKALFDQMAYAYYIWLNFVPALTAAVTPVWTPFLTEWKIEVSATGFKSTASLLDKPEVRLELLHPVPFGWLTIPDKKVFPDIEEERESKNSGPLSDDVTTLIFPPIFKVSQRISPIQIFKRIIFKFLLFELRGKKIFSNI